jgi:hypothetical protein
VLLVLRRVLRQLSLGSFLLLPFVPLLRRVLLLRLLVLLLVFPVLRVEVAAILLLLLLRLAELLLLLLLLRTALWAAAGVGLQACNGHDVAGLQWGSGASWRELSGGLRRRLRLGRALAEGGLQVGNNGCQLWKGALLHSCWGGALRRDGPASG